jgi:uncharacterized protein (TIGR02679 family)
MLSKWKKHGKIAGVIQIRDVTARESKALQRLMGKVYEGNPLKFKMVDFQKALSESRFGEITLEDLLSAYFDEKLVTTKSERLAKEEEKKLFWKNVMEEADKRTQGYDEAKQWILAMWEKKIYGYQLALSLFQNGEESAKNILAHVCNALWLLKLDVAEGYRLRLAVLSSQATGNPHYFDRNRVEGKLLLNALAYINECDYPQSAEKILELYYTAGISPDDVSSFTTAYGIHMYTEGGVHSAYEAFIEAREPYVVTLSNLNRIVKADCPGKLVYIVENQMVFSQICEDLKGEEVALVCTSGQVKTASLILIDLLCESGCQLFYSGDLDPEGICIADRMISRQPGQIVAWHMGPEDYAQSVSDEDIDNKRLKKLEALYDPELQHVATKVLSEKKAGYQEKLLELLERDIKNVRRLN